MDRWMDEGVNSWTNKWIDKKEYDVWMDEVRNR